MLSVFEHYSIPVEEIGFRTYRVGSAGAIVESFPGLPADGFTVSCDRDRALQREDIQFLTWDHPLVTGALVLILASEKGNSCMVRAAGRSSIEAIYLLECIAPAAFHIDRFLPPTPIRVSVDKRGSEQLPELLRRTLEEANRKVPRIIARARRDVFEQLGTEIDRLRQLRKVNPSVRSEEIELLLQQRTEMIDLHSHSRLRLDALRYSSL